MRGKKTGGRDFTLGESGNPRGRPPIPEDVRNARTINIALIVQALNRYFFLRPEELNSLEQATETTVVERILISLIKRAIDGDARSIEFLFMRFLGCMPEKSDSGMYYIKPEYARCLRSDGSLDIHSVIIDSIEEDQEKAIT